MSFKNGVPMKIELRQIEAAQRIQERLPIWSNTDKALQWVGENYTGFSLDACLLKTAAVNALYATNVRAVSRMAVGIHKLFENGTYAAHVKQNFGLLTEEGAIVLVEEIASTLNSQNKDEELVATAGGGTDKSSKPRFFRSFAAKFCHFFVSQSLFPIYDEAARKAITLHRPDMKEPGSYKAFVTNIRELREWCGLDVPFKDLDRYLWLRGMYETYRKNPFNAPINGELRSYFASNDPEVDRLLGGP